LENPIQARKYVGILRDGIITQPDKRQQKVKGPELLACTFIS
jgi:hypothetical protein